MQRDALKRNVKLDNSFCQIALLALVKGAGFLLNYLYLPLKQKCVSVMSVDLQAVSVALGWGYFVAWSASFYPQVVLNFQRKSVEGLALEFQVYNFTGFLSYSIYNIVGFLAQRHPDYTGSISIQPNDVVFALHAWCITTITCLQCLIYRRASHTVHPLHRCFCAFLWLVMLLMATLSLVGLVPWYESNAAVLSTVGLLGYIKILISIIKYVPQAWLNYTRKSTVGWSIGNILLDLTGGVLSFAQEFADAYRQNDWSLFTHNVPKLLLALVSVGFDLLFITQHYCLYTDRHETFREQDAGSYQNQSPRPRPAEGYRRMENETQTRLFETSRESRLIMPPRCAQAVVPVAQPRGGLKLFESRCEKTFPDLRKYYPKSKKYCRKTGKFLAFSRIGNHFSILEDFLRAKRRVDMKKCSQTGSVVPVWEIVSQIGKCFLLSQNGKQVPR
eukprot:g10654.t1